MDKLKLLELFLDGLPFYAYIKDKDGKFIYVNQKNADFMDLDQYIGKTDFEVMPFEMATRCVNQDKMVHQTKQPNFRFEFIVSGDQTMHNETYKFPILDDDENIIAICGYTKDNTHLKSENERAGAISQMLTSLESTDVTNLTLFECDLIKNKIVWNSKLNEFYEFSIDQQNYNLDSILNLIHPLDKQTIKTCLNQNLNDQSVSAINHEFRVITIKGHIKYVWCKAQIQRNHEGKAIRLLVLNLDITHTKKTEASLKQITERLSIATEAGAIGLWSLDVENMTFEWDMRMFELYNMPPTNTLKVAFSEWINFLHKEDIQSVMDQFYHDFNNKDLIFFAVNFRVIPYGSTEIRHFLAQGKIDRDSTGIPIGFTGVTVDVTLTHVNRIQDQKIAFLDKITSAGNWEYDLRKQRILFDSKMFDLYGIDPTKFTHKIDEWVAVLAPESREETLKRFRNNYENDSNVNNFTDEFEIIRPSDGKRVYIQTIAKIFRDIDGKALILQGINLDITEKKLQEKKLAENERLLKTLTQLSPVGIFRTNINGVINYITGAWQELTYLPIETSLNRLWYIDIYEEDQLNVYQIWRKCVELNQEITVECRFRELRNCQMARCYNCAHYLLIQLVPEYDQNHKLLGYIGTITNITDRKRSEKTILELNESLEKRVELEVARNLQQERILLQQSKLASMGEMIGNIAHQWRQPLTALNLIISNLKDAYEYDEFSKELLDNAVEQSTQLIFKMSNTIDDFRDFFRPNKVKVAFSLVEQIKDVVNLLSASFKSNDIDLHLNLKSKEDVQLWGYPNEFSQAILNILSNAKDVLIERKVDSPQIEIEISDDNKHGYIIISDNGGGINPEILPNIFDPYFTTKENGTGIGLYMTKIILEQNMNGQIKIYSKDKKTYAIIKNNLYKKNYN